MTTVLLTPAGLDAGCWRLMPALPGRVVHHEYPGHGARAAEPPVSDLDALAEQVLQLDDGPLDLIGVSMGGMVALHAALLDQGKVRSLMLACTNAGGRSQTMLERAAKAERDGVQAMIPETLERWFTPGALSRSPEHPGVSYARTALSQLSDSAFAADWRAIANHDVSGMLAQVQAITTVISGTEDVASPVERGRVLADGICDATMIELDAPHMVSLEQPDAFHAAILEHLRHTEGG